MNQLVLSLRQRSANYLDLNYLGHYLTADRVKMVPSYIEKILSWTTPKTNKDLSKWLGFVG